MLKILTIIDVVLYAIIGFLITIYLVRLLFGNGIVSRVVGKLIGLVAGGLAALKFMTWSTTPTSEDINMLFACIIFFGPIVGIIILSVIASEINSES